MSVNHHLSSLPSTLSAQTCLQLPSTVFQGLVDLLTGSLMAALTSMTPSPTTTVQTGLRCGLGLTMTFTSESSSGATAGDVVRAGPVALVIAFLWPLTC